MELKRKRYNNVIFAVIYKVPPWWQQFAKKNQKLQLVTWLPRKKKTFQSLSKYILHESLLLGYWKILLFATVDITELISLQLTLSFLMSANGERWIKEAFEHKNITWTFYKRVHFMIAKEVAINAIIVR